jgi:hypothetical protein
MPTKIAACCAMVVLACCLGSAAASAREPVTKVVPLHETKSVEVVQNHQIGIFAPDGRLWIAVSASATGAATLMEVAFPSGKVLLSRPLLSAVAALIVGPDGNIWFAGRSKKNTVTAGYMTVAGDLHTFTFDHCCVDGLAAGPDGNVWLSLEDLNPVLARISTEGNITTFDEHRRFSTWFSGLVPGPNGTLWTSVNAPSDDLAQVLTNGRVRPFNIHLNPETLDVNGYLRGWDGLQMAGLKPGRPLAVFPKLNASDPAFNTPAAMTLGADGQIWFTAFTTYDPPSVNPMAQPTNPPVLGVGSKDLPGTAHTWLSPFVTYQDSAVGDEIPGDNGLFPGPDGRLYALGYSASAPVGSTPLWRLFAVTLPDHPEMRPATVRIEKASRLQDGVAVTLRCLGQSGRFCSGNISLSAGKRVLTRSSYALAPGLEAIHTMDVATPARVNAVTVTSIDATSHAMQTRHAHFVG